MYYSAVWILLSCVDRHRWSLDKKGQCTKHTWNGRHWVLILLVYVIGYPYTIVWMYLSAAGL